MRLVKRLELLNTVIEAEVKLVCCPFCEEDERLRLDHTSRIFYVRCLTCETLGPTGDSQESALVQWNSRNGTTRV